MVNWLVLMEPSNYYHGILRALAHEGFVPALSVLALIFTSCAKEPTVGAIQATINGYDALPVLFAYRCLEDKKEVQYVQAKNIY